MKLSENEQMVLHILREDPYVTQQYIADKLLLSRPSVANLISGLQEKGEILGKPYMLKEKETVTCIGGANLDYTFRLAEALIMKTSNPVDSQISYGGVVRNIAENLVRLSHDVSLMTLVGEDGAGEDLLRDMRALMDVSPSKQLKYQTTGGYYSIINNHGDMDVGFADMSINDLMDREWILSNKRYLTRSKIMIADTNMRLNALEYLVYFAKTEGKRLVIVGVSGPKMANVPRDLEGVELLICNLDESQAYFNTNEKNVETLINKWLDKGVSNVVITLGKDGVMYSKKDRQVIHKHPWLVDEKEVVDVTGAGDAFCGALISELIDNQTLDQCVGYGIVNASLTIQSKHSVNKELSKNLLYKEYQKYEKR